MRRRWQGLEELLKLAFPPETQNQRPPRPPSPAPEPSQADGEGAEAPAEDEGAEAAPEDGAEAPAPAEAPESAQEPPPAVAEAPQPPAETTANFPGGKPLIWLAQYLKARNKQNTLETKAKAFDDALELAGKDVETLSEHYSNVFAAIRHILWPCSAYIARAKRIQRALPPTPEPPKPEGEEAEEEEAPPEEGEEAPPPKVKEVKYEDVAVLQYVATSHPMGPDAIEGWVLEYQVRSRVKLSI